METMKNQAMNDEQLEQIVGGAIFRTVEGASSTSNSITKVQNVAKYSLDALTSNARLDALGPEAAKLFGILGKTPEQFYAMSEEDRTQLIESLENNAALTALFMGHGMKEFL